MNFLCDDTHCSYGDGFISSTLSWFMIGMQMVTSG